MLDMSMASDQELWGTRRQAPRMHGTDIYIRCVANGGASLRR